MKKLLILWMVLVAFASCTDRKDLFDSGRVKEEAKENFPIKDIDPDQYNPQNEAFAIPKRSVPIFGPLSKTKCLIFYKIRTAFRWTSNPI